MVAADGLGLVGEASPGIGRHVWTLNHECKFTFDFLECCPPRRRTNHVTLDGSEVDLRFSF